MDGCVGRSMIIIFTREYYGRFDGIPLGSTVELNVLRLFETKIVMENLRSYFGLKLDSQNSNSRRTISPQRVELPIFSRANI